MAYTTWAQVLALYPPADDVESNSSNQTALIVAKSNYFSSFIRGVHKGALDEPVDEVVNLAVAHLIIGELRLRRRTDDGEMEIVSFDHISGKFFDEEIRAHAVIQAINRGSIVLTEDHAERDVHHPEAIPDSANTSTGKVSALLPHEYKSNREDTLIIKITTAGRVDDGTAKFDWYRNNAATAEDTAVVMSSDWTHLLNEAYVRFRDSAQSGEQFAINDTWTVTLVPPTSETQSSGLRAVEVFST